MPRAGPQLVVEAPRQLVEPVAPRADRPRRRVRLALGEHDLAGAEELARGEERLGRGRALGAPGGGCRSTRRARRGRGRARSRSRARPAASTRLASEPGPPAAALAHVGADGEGVALRRALAQVASGGVEQLVEVARHGERRARARRASTARARRFSSERRWRSRPAAVTSTVIVAARPAAASAAVTTAVVDASSTSIASVTSLVEKCRPSRCPARPGVPSQPADSCGMSVSGAGWSRPPETRWGSAAVPSAASSASPSSPRSAPQKTMTGSGAWRASRTTLVPPLRRWRSPGRRCMSYFYDRNNYVVNPVNPDVRARIVGLIRSASCQNETNVGGVTDGGAPSRGQRIGARARAGGAHPRADLAGGARSPPRPLAGEPHAAQQAVPRPRLVHRGVRDRAGRDRPAGHAARRAGRLTPVRRREAHAASRPSACITDLRAGALDQGERPLADARRRRRRRRAVADLVGGAPRRRRRRGGGRPGWASASAATSPTSASSRARRSSAGATCRSPTGSSSELGVPVTVENDVTALTTAEQWFGAVRGTTRLRRRHDRRGRRLRARRARPRDHDARLGPRPRRSPAARPQRAALRRRAPRMLHRDAVDPEHHRAGRHRARPRGGLRRGAATGPGGASARRVGDGRRGPRARPHDGGHRQHRHGRHRSCSRARASGSGTSSATSRSPRSPRTATPRRRPSRCTSTTRDSCRGRAAPPRWRSRPRSGGCGCPA